MKYIAGVSKKHLKTIMAMAKGLQTQYNGLDIASTQNVRNPVSMKKLVLATLKTNTGMMTWEIRMKLVEHGFRVNDGGLSVALNILKNRGLVKSKRASASQRKAVRTNSAKVWKLVKQ